MKALIQRVKEASVVVDGETTGAIEKGILIFLGITHEDGPREIEALVDKIVNLRIFENDGKRMDFSIKDLGGDLLVVSQFTLYGSLKKGRRPDFGDAANPEKAKELYNLFVEECRKTELKVETGEFAAMMDVSLINDGPVTFLLDSKDLLR
ncbi:D-aminoacyl-tRNA deacylase [Patescibacteria group bacterium]